MNRSHPRSLSFCSQVSCLGLLSVLLLVPTGCGEDEVPEAGQRGVPGAKAKSDEGKESRRTAKTAPTTPAGDFVGEPEEEGPGVKRPPPALDQTSFVRRRDPFQGFVAAEPTLPEPDPVRAERRVELRQYAFEDLRLVIITSSRSAGTPPRVTFVASDGKSGTVRQGQHFSSAEVLLAAVNRDYVEIEVVDEELAAGLGMQRGERRALYLRNE